MKGQDTTSGFKEAYKVKVELTMFLKYLDASNEQPSIKSEHYVNVKILTDDDVAVNLNIIHEPFALDNETTFSLEDLVRFLLNSPYTKGNYALPESFLKKETK